MLVVCHYLDKNIPEDVLHDTGVKSMITSDSQAMGHVGEVVVRTWRTASKMKTCGGPLADLSDSPECDNGRVKRYISKYTINPLVRFVVSECIRPNHVCVGAITHGISKYGGSVEVGKLVLALWNPENFGAKPEMVLKAGIVVWAQVRLSCVRFLPLNPPAPFH